MIKTKSNLLQKKMRSSKKTINSSLRKNLMENLYQLFAGLDTKKDVEGFLNSFLTKAELLNFSKRLAIIQMLDDKIPYGQIKKKLGVSSATIASIAELIQKKPQGIITGLKNMQAEAWADSTIKKITGLLKI